jgi:hypothetical protein
MGSFDDEVEEGLDLSVAKACCRFGPPLGQKEEKLIKVLRGDLIEGSVTQQRLQASQ